MAFTNYTELQDAITAELEKSGNSKLVSAIPDLIKLAEMKLNRDVVHYLMSTTIVKEYTSASREVVLPSDMEELLSVAIKKGTDDDLKYETLPFKIYETFTRYYRSDAGEPNYYTLRDVMELNRTADQDYSLRLYYRVALDIATSTTNWLLTKYPDLYLYGSCLQAERFLRDDERLPIWVAFFTEAMESVNNVGAASEDDAELSLRDLCNATRNRDSYYYDYRTGGRS